MSRSVLLLLVLTVLLGKTTAQASVSGKLQSLNDIYPIHLGSTTKDISPYIRFELNANHKFKNSIRFYSRLMGLSNLESKYEPERFYGDVQEGYLEFRHGNFKLLTGMNTVNWAIVDVSSPSDVVNPQVLFQPLRIEKRGAPMVETKWQGDTFGLDLIYIPVQQRPLLPSQDSRWLPRDFLVNVEAQGYKIILPSKLSYDYYAPESLDHALNNNFGGRLEAHSGSWDFHLMYFQGTAPSPKVHLTLESDPGPANELIARTPIHISIVSYRIQTTGLGVVWAGNKWIFRFESAYQDTLSRSPLLQPWSWANVVAAETNFSIGTQTLTVLGQIYYTRNPQAPDNLISSSYRLFDQTAGLGGRWAYSGSTTILFSGFYEAKTQGTFWSVDYQNKLSDNLQWTLGWRDFSARKDGLIKTFDKNDFANLGMTYYF